MKRYHWEREGQRYIIRDRLRGYPDSYSDRPRAMAVCYTADDAERIVDALNATVRNGG